AYTESVEPEKLIQCPYNKTRQIRACRFPHHLTEYGKSHAGVVNWLLVPSALATSVLTRFLGPKSVIVSQAVMIKAVLSRMLSTKSGTLDKRLWLSAHGSALLVMKAGIKICGNRPAPHLSGAQPTTVATTTLPAIQLGVLEKKSNLASGMRIPLALPYSLP
ncbi:unnamed protein product, partial [Gulo gulo]